MRKEAVVIESWKTDKIPKPVAAFLTFSNYQNSKVQNEDFRREKLSGETLTKRSSLYFGRHKFEQGDETKLKIFWVF